MYKVFFKRNYFYFTNKIPPNAEELVLNRETMKIMLPVLINNLNKNEAVKVTVSDQNPKETFSVFAKHFKEINAAGGVVENTKGEIILIYRNNFWDLPKGKQEQEESIEHTALREVKEEVGTTDIEIVKFIDYSYHIYKINNEWVIKKTAWYLMKTTNTTNLTPQLIEGIERATWVKLKEISKYLPDMYPLIIDILQKYLDLKLKQPK